MKKLIFKPLATATVLVVGDIILDQYIYGETNRISREAPVPVVSVGHTESRPGGAANVAVNVSALGLSVQLLGLTGEDDEAQQLEKLLQEHQVVPHFIRHPGYKTIIKQRILSQQQQLIRLDYETAASAVAKTNAIVDRYLTRLGDSQVVILSDYASGSLQQVQTLIKQARQQGIAVFVDPRAKDFSCYQHANVLTPNQREFEAVVGHCASVSILVEKGIQLCTTLKLDALLITRGKSGMTLLRPDKAPLHLNASAREVYDVTGAGDTVIAVLAAAVASDYPLPQAAKFANTAAGLVVEKLGSSSVTSHTINTALLNTQTAALADKNTALKMVQAAKQAGKKIIMTNGCFDMLHAGHVNYLAQAKLLGDWLIVAVNDDDSVTRLKGSTRPINPLVNRAAVLSALQCVDLVVAFSEDTPEQLITMLQPDILVKGGDYTEAQVAGGSWVKAHGGAVVILPYQAGCSTTAMLEKINTMNSGPAS